MRDELCSPLSALVASPPFLLLCRRVSLRLRTDLIFFPDDFFGLPSGKEEKVAAVKIARAFYYTVVIASLTE